METAEEAIEAIKLLKPGPDDIIVVKVVPPLSAAGWERVHTTMRAALGEEAHVLLTTDGEIDLDLMPAHEIRALGYRKIGMCPPCQAAAEAGVVLNPEAPETQRNMRIPIHKCQGCGCFCSGRRQKMV